MPGNHNKRDGQTDGQTTRQALSYSLPQRFKIIYIVMGPWDPLWAMILMGPRALEMGAIVDVSIHCNFRMRPQDAGS